MLKLKLINLAIVGSMILLILFVESQPTYAQNETLGVRTEIYFEYEPEYKSGEKIPKINIHKIDYKTGRGTKETYTYPEKAIEVPEKMRFSEGFAFSNMYLLQTSNGLVGYWVSTYKFSSDGINKEHIGSRLYAFDLSTKKWSMILDVQDLLLRFYPQFGGYAVFPEDYYNLTSSVNVYTLPSQKLIKSIDNLPEETNHNINNYTRQTTPGTLRISIPVTKKKTLNGRTFEYSDYVKYELFSDGKMEELILVNPSNHWEWQRKVGELLYYIDTKRKEDTYGYLKDGKFTPYYTEGMKTIGFEFSPNNKYIIMYETSKDKQTKSEYENSIIDAKTGKIIHKFPAFGDPASGDSEVYNWLFGDEIVRVDLFSPRSFHKPIYLNLSSGIYMHDIKRYMEYDYFHYSGSYDELLTSEVPAQLVINGKPVVYSGQGTFHKENDKWYVGARDFVSSVGATVNLKNKQLVFTKGGYSFTVEESNIIHFKGRAYFPVDEITKGFGYVSTIYTGFGELGTRSIFLYSEEFTEKDMLVLYPDAEEKKSDFFIMDEDQVLYIPDETNAINAIKADYHSYSYMGHELTFLDGKLVSIEYPLSLESMQKGIGISSSKSKVVEVLGPSKKEVRFDSHLTGMIYSYEGYSKMITSFGTGYLNEVILFH